MVQSGANAYMNNSVSTASPQELTLMLYNGAIKFANQGLVELDNKNIEKVNNNLMRVQDIISEFRITLNRDVPIAKEMDKLYEYMIWRLTEANMSKDKAMVEEVIEMLRELRDTWKEAMKLAKTGNKPASGE
ncbi:flagellar protein FliS [Natranaerovirga pectinivora]|uniref:Flagellar secretion chaperone FliS n=1 Tax=Natranaerovirga pectinivora TaxID=682400 RepID=A0A4R3MIN4_9FIRM|nr:flagellar export chaperone FliS [Natranaerovirga pectinivora]TCT14047.1 flagellar protein FliS [Natranaerovirga pectinivora]